MGLSAYVCGSQRSFDQGGSQGNLRQEITVALHTLEQMMERMAASRPAMHSFDDCGTASRIVCDVLALALMREPSCSPEGCVFQSRPRGRIGRGRHDHAPHDALGGVTLRQGSDIGWTAGGSLSIADSHRDSRDAIFPQ